MQEEKTVPSNATETSPATPVTMHFAENSWPNLEKYRNDVVNFVDSLIKAGDLRNFLIKGDSEHKKLSRTTEYNTYQEDMDDAEFLKLIEKLCKQQPSDYDFHSYLVGSPGHLYPINLVGHTPDNIKHIAERILKNFDTFSAIIVKKGEPPELVLPLFLAQFYEEYTKSIIIERVLDGNNDELIAKNLYDFLNYLPLHKEKILYYVFNHEKIFHKKVGNKQDFINLFLVFFDGYQSKIFDWMFCSNQFTRIIRNIDDLCELAEKFPDEREKFYNYIFSHGLIQSIESLNKAVSCFHEHRKDLFEYVLNNDKIFNDLILSVDKLAEFGDLFKEFKDNLAQHMLTNDADFVRLFYSSRKYYFMEGSTVPAEGQYREIGLKKFGEIFPTFVDRAREKLFSTSFQTCLKKATSDEPSHKPFYGFSEFTKEVPNEKVDKKRIAELLEGDTIDSMAFFNYIFSTPISNPSPTLVFSLQNNNHCDKSELCNALYNCWNGPIKKEFPSITVIRGNDGMLVVEPANPKLLSALLPAISGLILQYYPPLQITRWGTGILPKKIVTKLSIESWEKELREKFSDPDLRLVRVAGINGGSIRLLTMKPGLIAQIQSQMTGIGKSVDEHQIEIPFGKLSEFKNVLDELPGVSNEASEEKNFPSIAKVQETWLEQQEQNLPSEFAIKITFSIKIETMFPDGKKSCVLLELQKECASCFWHVMHKKIPDLSPVDSCKFSMPLADLSKIINDPEIPKGIDEFFEMARKAKMLVTLHEGLPEIKEEYAGIVLDSESLDHAPSATSFGFGFFGSEKNLDFSSSISVSVSAPAPAPDVSSDNGSSSFGLGFFDPERSSPDSAGSSSSNSFSLNENREQEQLTSAPSLSPSPFKVDESR